MESYFVGKICNYIYNLISNWKKILNFKLKYIKVNYFKFKFHKIRDHIYSLKFKL